ncbi:TetR/AcrR family transcriptional regulator [Mucilaginibacter sp. E4BP6]|uniref:TetR/AcrR family transcriptional regulator n=1 Tax=Mucilaginibacter sp. E4BP6 TaxID=2723089 RepID=UPI0015CB4F60|nr:TetR/AcrR family transcriptional regulator [Mucilaginibacter sp. E4BP6]NYE66979.1 AcrR family transcriptional regulator [Mucilaginibacter sp. E4BP6]
MSKSERTRQFIIEQSAPLFNKKGLAGTAMSDVMAATKMAKGGLYGHFESKDELSYAVVDYNLGKLVDKVDYAINKASTAKDKLFAFLDVFSTPTQFPVEGGCPMLNFGTEADDTSPVITQKVKGTILAAQTKIAAIIGKGIASGELKATFDAREFSIKTMTLIEGGTLIGRVLETNSQMEIVLNILKKEIEQQVI